MSQHPVNDIVATRAKHWFIQYQAGFNEQQRADFEQWLGRHPDHQREFQRLTTLWQELDMIAGDFVNTDKSKASVTASPAGPLYKHKPYWLPAAAACLLLVFSLAVHRPDPTSAVVPPSGSYYSSHKGELQSIQLSDGSYIQLAPGSVVQTYFDQKQRRVELIAGEAFFEVAKDTERPFVVSTLLGDTRAVGTAFNVQLHSRQLDVTVHEGVVDVLNGKQSAVARLGIGQQATVLGDGQVETRSDVDLSYSAAWRRGTLVFSNQPLSQVVDDLNRYSQVLIVIADDRLLDIQVSGIFKGHDIDAVLEAIESSLPTRLSRSGQRISLHYNEEV